MCERNELNTCSEGTIDLSIFYNSECKVSGTSGSTNNFKTLYYPLGEISNLNFDIVDISIEVHFVYKLYGSHGGNFGEYSCFEPWE